MSQPHSGVWWLAPNVWAGAALSGTAVTASFSPSLMPRSTTHQALLAGASGTVGWMIGSGSYTIAARTGNTGLDTAVLAAGAAAGIATRYLVPWHDQEPRWRAPVRSIAQVAGAGAASAATVTAVQHSRSRTLAGVAVGVAAGIVAGSRIRSSVAKQDAARGEYDLPTPNATRAVIEGVGVLSILGALISGYRSSGGALSRTLEQRLGVPNRPARIAGTVLAAGVWALGIRVAAGSIVTGLARYDRVLDPGYDHPPASTNRSGGPDSRVPWSRLGRQGRRFITNVPRAADITSVMGVTPLHEPIRVFVGFDAATEAVERVEIAMEELRRMRAFDRKLLIASCPAGTGYVNTLPMEVADFAMLGDSAAVAVQYARLPSLLAIQNMKAGANHHRLLLEAIRRELADRPHDRRPTVVVYGESLGAWAGQDAFIDAGIEGLDALGVDHALWVGTPFYSKWRRQTVEEGRTPLGVVVEVNAPDDLETSSRRRVTMLTHWNDPVAKVNLSMFYREPDWLMESPRRPTISQDQVWFPIITGLQTVVDTFNATNPTPGVFRATGHDYRLDLPEATVAAYRLPEPTAPQWERLMRHLQAEEKRRDDDLRHGERPITPESVTGDRDPDAPVATPG